MGVNLKSENWSFTAKVVPFADLFFCVTARLWLCCNSLFSNMSFLSVTCITMCFLSSVPPPQSSMFPLCTPEHPITTPGSAWRPGREMLWVFKCQICSSFTHLLPGCSSGSGCACVLHLFGGLTFSHTFCSSHTLLTHFYLSHSTN